MSEWIDMAEWARCAEMARPGIVFEIRNGEGLSLFTPCTAELPELPFDWKQPALEFRAVDEQPPEHSNPLPPPAG
jgi:hypothetical protein